MDTEQARRVAQNESRFRAMNERMTIAVEDFRGERSGGDFAVMCECAVSECDQDISISPQQYARVRSNPRWYVVLPDHVLPATEEPVERFDGYWIIEKTGPGGDVAEELA
ncbi:MAG: hypothetical protein JWM86_1782 [Thermoleophilia bacterium]|nr:hypothetical protein [Thermoleophilia bacterium]